MNDWTQLKGLFVILAGIYCLLLANGVVPLKPRDPERLELWRRKFGGLMNILAPIVILSGIAQMLGLFH